MATQQSGQQNKNKSTISSSSSASGTPDALSKTEDYSSDAGSSGGYSSESRSSPSSSNLGAGAYGSDPSSTTGAYGKSSSSYGSEGMSSTSQSRKMQKQNGQHREGNLAKSIEHQTSRIPSDVFLWAAGAAIVGAAALKFTGREGDAQFVGQWAPTLLVLGLYNKIVKRFGSDSMSGEESHAYT